MDHEHNEPKDIGADEGAHQRQGELAKAPADGILDEIDEVLEENQEEFVRTYVEKGGQGQSFTLTVETLAVMAAQGIPQGLAYDGFKRIVGGITKVFRKETGRASPSPLENDEDYDPEIEAKVLQAYETAERVLEQLELQHTDAEAEAFKGAVIAMGMQSQLGLLRIGPERYRRLAGAAEARELDPSDLAKRIIDNWLRRN